MFHKKNKTKISDNTRRQPVVQPSNKSSTFSYRSSRSRIEQSTGRKEEVKREVDRHGWLVYLPTYFAFATIVCSLVYASTLSSRPKVEVFTSSKTSTILKNDNSVYEQAMADLMGRSVLNYSKLTLDSNYIAQQLSNRFPELKAASIAIPLVNRQPVLRLELAEPVLVINSNGKQYALSGQGIALIDVTASQIKTVSGIPLVDDQTNIPVKVGSPALTNDTVKFIRTVVGELRIKDIKVKSLSLPRTAEELDVHLEGVTYYLKLNLLNEPKQQAGAYLALRQKLSNENIRVAEYVDLRVDERVYYK